MQKDDSLNSSFIVHPSSFILHPSSFIIPHSSFILHRSSFILHRSSFILHHSSFIIHRSSFILHRSSFILHHSSFIIHRLKAGFSLIEVVVSTIIIAMMMVSLLTFVAYGGDLWQRNHAVTNLNNEGNMLLDAIEREMSLTTAVSLPATVGATGDELRYTKDIYDWAGPPRNKATTPQFRIYLQAGTRIVSSQYVSGSLIAPDTPAWTVQTTDPAGTEVQKLVTKLFDYDLARHILTFDVTRQSTNRIGVRIVLNVIRADDGIEWKTEMKRDMMIPGL